MNQPVNRILSEIKLDLLICSRQPAISMDKQREKYKFLISHLHSQNLKMRCGDKIWTRILSGVGSEEGTGDQRLPATFTHGGHPPRIGIFVEIGFLSASQQYLCFLFLGICQFSICIPCPHRCFGLPGGAADVRCPHFGIWEGRTLLFVSSTYFRTLLQLWFLFHF